MSARRFALAIVAPPLLVALPLATLFLACVMRYDTAFAIRVGVAGFVVYALAAAAAAFPLSRAVDGVHDHLSRGTDPSAALSLALNRTALVAAALWIGAGLVLAVAAFAILAPSFLGAQYFVEAALLVAAPAMAWSYWAGKGMLLRIVADAPRIEYTGRMWSIGVKIAIVFIGFFFVSVGALVLVVSSQVASRLGTEAAAAVGRAGLLIAMLTTAVFAVATWFLAHDVTSPLQELMRLSAEMAQGRFSTEPRIFADDEVGELARSFGATRRNLRGLIARVGDRGESITGGVRAMTSGTSSLVDNAHEQKGMAQDAATALDAVRNEAQSVLRDVDRVSELTCDSASRANELRASFTEVAKRMDDLFHSVEKSSSAATEIDASARESASRTMTLSGIGSDVLAFVAEMEATVSQITRTAQTTADLSGRVREDAAAGRAAVEATMEGIRNTQESTRRTSGEFEALRQSLGQIDQILAFIDEVTNRTNLLSLNAAIIAAQAGAHDYGFSVIADEVRQLADRTRTATKEIAAIIRGVQPFTRQAVEALDVGVQNVDRSVALAQNASRSLQTIMESAERSQEMVRTISHALEEQARASQHLHGTAARMSDNLMEMNRASQGQAEATRMLAVEAERVRDIALQVKRATGEQTSAGEGIAGAMENIATDVASIRDRLDRQLQQAEQVASASRVTLKIAERNNGIAEDFRESLESLLRSGQDFETEVARFRS